MRFSLTEHPWLPRPPADFREQCRAVGSASQPGAALQHLASHNLTQTQASGFANALRKCRETGAGLAPLVPFRLGVVANSTLDLVLEALPAAAARFGLALEIVATPFDQVLQQALAPDSGLNRARTDAVLLALDHRWYGMLHARLDGSDERAKAEALDQLTAVVKALRAHGGAPGILQTVPVPPISLFGSFDRNVRGSLRQMIADINDRVVALAAETGSYVADIAALVERVGADEWFDPVQWNTYKLPCAGSCSGIYADTVARLLGAIRGRTRKCLVLDLDNTVWGGVIGDDGLEGIVIGSGDPIGEAHLELQRYALDLRERGIMLAVCSKNDDATARLPFQQHPEMLLKEDHIAVFQANWVDKPSNLEAIAGALNIGLDALVLVDDNPAERAQVRAALPMVAVPELPNDVSLFVRHVAAAGYFETTTFSAEDRQRADFYAADARRAQVHAKARNLDDYLSSLEMVITFAPFDAVGRKRITQLINKSNQFNLTTPRYTEAQVADFEHDPSTYTLQVRLRDRFGDLGMIAVVVCTAGDREPRSWTVDTWLMSCRVLGRDVERAMLNEIMSAARQRGVETLYGVYRPTPKNHMVADHYRNLGFAPAPDSGAKDGVFMLRVAEYAAPAVRLSIERSPTVTASAA